MPVRLRVVSRQTVAELPVEVVAIAGVRSGFVAFASDGEVYRLTCLGHEAQGLHGLAAEALACAIAAVNTTPADERARWREAKARRRLESSLDLDLAGH